MWYSCSCFWDLCRTVRQGDGFVLDVKKCTVYSRIRQFFFEITSFENSLPPPYLHGFRLHSRVAPSTWNLDTGNELDNSVRQTPPINGEMIDWLIAFQSADFCCVNFRGNVREKSIVQVVLIFLSREELFDTTRKSKPINRFGRTLRTKECNPRLNPNK